MNSRVKEPEHPEKPDYTPLYSRYYLAITSDPQYPWTKESDDDLPQAKKDTKIISERLIRDQYESIIDFKKKKDIKDINFSTIINGDVTAFGHGGEWTKAKILMRILENNYYFSLGNHDIENNKGDCVSDECLRRSLLEMAEFLDKKKKENAKFETDHFLKEEYTYTNNMPVLNYRVEGSLSYSFDPSPFLKVINLQYYPTYEVNSNGHPKRECSSSVGWFEEQMKKTNTSDRIVIFLHKPNQWKNGPSEEFKNILEKYRERIICIFCGHYHRHVGQFDSSSYFGDIPVYLSGSASQESYLIASYNYYQMEVYQVVNNSWENREKIASFQMRKEEW